MIRMAPLVVMAYDQLENVLALKNIGIQQNKLNRQYEKMQYYLIPSTA